MRRWLVPITALLIAGCVGNPEPAAEDAGPLATDAGAPLPECLPEGSGLGRTCPDGCRGLDGTYIDPERDCTVWTTRVVALCIPEGVTYAGNGEMGCFRLRDDPEVRIETGTTGVLWEGSAEDEFARQGWERCDETPGFFRPCE